MRTILIALLLLYAISAEPQCLDLDIVVLADYSGSVQNYEDVVISAIESFATAFDLEPNGVNVGVVMFNTEATVVSQLGHDANEILAQTSLLRAAKAGGGTNMRAGLQMAASELLTNGRPGYRRLVIIISDGDVDLPEETLSAPAQLQLMAIQVCAVLIKNNTSKSDFMQQISGGCYAETDYENLSSELKKLDLCL